MNGIFYQLGDWIARFKWYVVGAWILALGLSIPGVINLSSVLVTGGYEVPESDSGRGTEILFQEFGQRTATSAVLIFSSDTLSIDDPSNTTLRDAVDNTSKRVREMPQIKEVSSYLTSGSRRFVSADGKTTYAILNYGVSEQEAQDLTPDIRERIKDQPAGIRAQLLGFPAQSHDLAEESDHDLEKAELVSLPISLVLLVLVFGTILAAGLPLILGVFSVAIAFAGIYVIAQNVETSLFAKNTASMIGLGLGIDFSLLMVSRYREELQRGFAPRQATANTVATAGRSIVFSALTVMLGLSVLLLYKLALIRSIAIGMLLVAGTSMFAAVTLLPALLAIFGTRINALRLIPSKKKPANESEDTGIWHRWALTVMRNPWPFLLLTLAILIGLAWPAREINAIGVGSAKSLPTESKTRQAFETLVTAFGAGEATPTLILVRAPTPNGAFEPATLEGVYQLVKTLQADNRVARVDSLVGLAENFVPNISEQQFKSITREQYESDPRGQRVLTGIVNTRRSADTHMLVVMSKQDELGADSISLVKDIRDKFIPSVRALNTPTFDERCSSREPVICSGVFVSGDTALTLDYRNELLSQFPQLVIMVLVVTYVVLLLFFHSLILPLKAILMNVASILASYGVLVLVFQYGFGENILDFEHQSRMSMFSPVILFSILFGLSTDYEVFLLSRVRELYFQSKNNESSVAIGLERTAGIITAAGLIMIVVFGSFALGSTLVVKELGVGLAVAVFLDSTIIRVIMVPASMKLLGSGNWWMPKFLDWIPQIKEGGESEPPAPVHAQRHGQASIAPGAVLSCPRCGAALRPGARFCGKCGAQSQSWQPRGPGAPVHELRHATAVDTPARAAAVHPGGIGTAVAQGPAPRRIPIIIQRGNQQVRAWLVLRDCSVEPGIARDEAQRIEVLGIDIGALQGSEPEIQIRNARVRL
ncbi:MAG: MMPL family transporter [Chloroflexota bacterium]